MDFYAYQKEQSYSLTVTSSRRISVLKQNDWASNITNWYPWIVGIQANLWVSKLTDWIFWGSSFSDCDLKWRGHRPLYLSSTSHQVGLPQGTHIRIVKSCIIFLLDTKTHRYEIAVNVYAGMSPISLWKRRSRVPKMFQKRSKNLGVLVFIVFVVGVF